MKGIEKDIERLQMRNLSPLQIIERVAQEHGLTVEGMISKGNPVGVGPARRSAIRRMANAGHTAAAIAEALCRDIASVQRVLKDEGKW